MYKNTASGRPMQIKTESIEVEVITQHYRVLGKLHKVPHGRLTDFLNRSSVQGSSENSFFLPITDATYISLSNPEVQFKAKFLTINKAHIEMLIPR